jgi:hypothetical protein
MFEIILNAVCTAKSISATYLNFRIKLADILISINKDSIIITNKLELEYPNLL